MISALRHSDQVSERLPLLRIDALAGAGVSLTCPGFVSLLDEVDARLSRASNDADAISVRAVQCRRFATMTTPSAMPPSKINSEMSEFFSKAVDLSFRGLAMSNAAATEARDILLLLAGKQQIGTRLKTVWPSLASLTGISARRVKAIWYREARAILAEEIDRLRSAAARRRERDIQSIFNDATRLEAMARSLEAIDADFHRAEIDRLRDVARRARAGVSAEESAAAARAHHPATAD